MTTNITPIEALEQIEELTNEIRETANAIDEENYGRLDVRIAQFAKQIEDIATQALAPQECDVTKQELYCDSCPEPDKTRCLERKGRFKDGYAWLETYVKNNCGSHTDTILEQVNALKIYPNRCDYVLEKQLHSQQKTFTVEEVREIIINNCDSSLNYINCENNNCSKYNYDCRKCLLKELEKTN